MIPRTPGEWSAILPNETDCELTKYAWLAGLVGRHSIQDRVAAASRLHEYERCVERVATERARVDNRESPSEADFIEARRILEVK